MAKDVDLSSKEWLDIVFEGKNKEFGAFKLRNESPKRHTKALLIVIGIFAAIGIALWLSVSGIFSQKEEDANAGNEQVLADLSDEEEKQDEEVEDIPIIEQEEEPEPEIEQEEALNSIQDTIIKINDDEKVENEVKNKEEVFDTTAAVGNVDVSDGVDDLTKTLVKDEIVVEEKKPEPEKEIVYTVANVQQQPTFPGGEAEMYKWLSSNIQYPAAAAEEGVDGRVVVEFVVSKTGAIENVRVVRGRHPALDKEAIRVVKAMPKWNPGRNNGQPVKVTYNLPVSFKLQK